MARERRRLADELLEQPTRRRDRAERERLERARRAKQLERKTKADIRKQEARERAALTRELIQYILMMMLYFYVLLCRPNRRTSDG